jgi:DNA transposition AAA+ family ATPase
MMSRIRVLRNQEREDALRRSAGRVKTLTVQEIFTVCQKAWSDRLVAFIFANSHVGKTEALKWFRDENNHGATLYVDLQGVTGVQDIYREFAKALRISAERPISKLMPAVHAAIDRTNLVIVDEFHHITYAYQKGSSIRMVNALKSIKDRTGCGMVICATDVGREEIESGKESKLLSQLWRRGTIKLQLPSALRVADVRAFAEAYQLDFPAATPGTDTWKGLELENPDFAGLRICDRIAHDYGVQHLVSVFRDGGALAKKAKRDVTWADVISAQGVYDGLSAKKKA